MHNHSWHLRRRGHFGGGHHGFGGPFGHFMGGGGKGFRAARMLASDDLQLVILALLKEKPRHGYDLIKALEERSSGIYVPSPGVVYPALTYLEEAEFATSEAEGNKKLFKITESGLAHLEKNQEIVDETLKQLELFGHRMARMRKHFSDEEAEDEMINKSDWKEIKMEFKALKDELKAIIRDNIFSSKEEKKRILDILKKAITEIRAKE